MNTNCMKCNSLLTMDEIHANGAVCRVCEATPAKSRKSLIVVAMLVVIVVAAWVMV